jgi:hypothetical protein
MSAAMMRTMFAMTTTMRAGRRNCCGSMVRMTPDENWAKGDR